MASTSSAPKPPCKTSKQCNICLLSEHDEYMYGELMTKGELAVHYFCLLSAPDIPQRGGDNAGILGFCKMDILNSFKKYRNLKCFYCKSKSAAVHCSFEGCDRTWHYPCGVENNCMTQFVGSFPSFCDVHVPDPNENRRPEDNAMCKACYEPLGPFSLSKCIIASCCLEQYDDWPKSFLHKECIVKYCKNAGYDSMCLTCSMTDGRTREEWQNEMRLKGIFIPMAMAVWENDDHFKKQVKKKCNLPGCQYKGNDDVYTCFVCGCFPLHLRCAKVYQHQDYLCPKCFDQSFVQRVPVL